MFRAPDFLEVADVEECLTRDERECWIGWRGRSGNERDTEHKDSRHALRQRQGRQPGKTPAPVMADHGEPIHSECISNAGDVSNALHQSVVLDARWLARAPISAQVRLNRRVSGFGQSLDLCMP